MPTFRIDDRVRVRDSEREDWKTGLVTELRGDKPVVKLQGQSRGFTWTFVEHADTDGGGGGGGRGGSGGGGSADVLIGDTVRVRDSEREDWKTGTVTEMRGNKPVVKLQGQSRGFTWTFFEPLGGGGGGGKSDREEKKSSGGSGGDIMIGDTVRVRDNEREDWKTGTVTEMRGNKPVVKLQGQSRGFTWTFFEPAAGSKGSSSRDDREEKKPSGGGDVQIGDRIRVRDSEREDWKTGTVTEMRGNKPVVKLQGQSRGFTWTFFEPLGGGGGGGKSDRDEKKSSGGGSDDIMIGDTVRVRDNEREDWKTGTVTEMRGNKPVVKLQGQSRGFTWTFFEPLGGGGGGKSDRDEKKSSGGSGGDIMIGDTVRVRDNEREDWKTGTVTEMRGNKPVVKLQGQSRGFTWTFFEALGGGGGSKSDRDEKKPSGGGSDDIMIGDTVRVRDNEREDWKTGTVTEMRGNKPVVKLQGQSRGFTWTFFEPLGGGGGGKSDREEKKSSGGSGGDITIGDTVRVRDNEREDWKTGTVTEMRGNKPVVKLQGQSRGFTWTFFEPLGGGKSDRDEKKSSGGGSDDIMIGDTVRVRDNEREDWKTGTVTEMRGNKPVVKLQGQSRGFTWTFFEPLGGGGGGKSDRDEKKSSGGSGGDIMIGDTVRVRDSEREDWKTGTVTEMRGNKPVVKLQGQSRGFTWTFFEPLGGGGGGGKSDRDEKKSSGGSGGDIMIGDTVRVRDNEREDWKTGTVTEMRGNKPVVKLQGQSRGFTWTFFEPLGGGGGGGKSDRDEKKSSGGGSDDIMIGDTVRVRDNEREDWKTGTVTEMRGNKPVVKLQGQSRGSTWTFFEPLGGGGGGGKSDREEKKSSGGSGGDIMIGDTVRVRDNEREDWKTGTVTEMRGNKPVVKLQGQSRGFTWTFFEPLGGGGGSKSDRDEKKSSGGGSDDIMIGDTVRVRDNEREDWKTGTVTEMRGNKPVVKLQGQSRGFTWTFFEPLGGGGGGGKSDRDKKPAGGSGGDVQVGDRMRVRDNEREDWKMGTVTEMRGNKPVVKLEGQSRGFTWTFFEPADSGKSGSSRDDRSKKPSGGSGGDIMIGDTVRVRDHEREDWKTGTVTEMRGDKPVVKLEGQSRGFTWTFFEPLGGGGGGKSDRDEKKPSGGGSDDIMIGDTVRVRDNEREDWKTGTVTEMRGNKPVVKLQGQSRGFTWTFFEPLGGAKDAKESGAASSARGRSSSSLQIGDTVRVRDNEREDWKTGTVTEMRGNKPVVKLQGQSRGFTWTFFEPLEESGDAGAGQGKSSGGGDVQIGDRMRVRDSDKEDWKVGVVTGMRGSSPCVKLDGQSRGFAWTFWEPLDGGDKKGSAAAAAAPRPAPPQPRDGGERAPAPPPRGGGGGGGGGGSFVIGDRVRVRDNEREDWKTGTVTEVRGSKPAVKLDGQSRGFTWTFCEPADEKAPAPPQKGGGGGGGGGDDDFVVGDGVRVRDSDAEAWKSGTVTDLRGGRPVVSIPGQSRSFTWTYVVLDKGGGGPDDGAAPRPPRDEKNAAPAAAECKFNVGDRVRVKDSPAEEWKPGTVVSVNQSGQAVVRIQGQSRGFTWTIVDFALDEKTASGGGGGGGGGGGDDDLYQVGDRVLVRDEATAAWANGTVVTLTNAGPMVRLDGQSKPFRWRYTKMDKGGSLKVGPGDKVRVRDRDDDEWRNATVVSVAGTRVHARLEGQASTFEWAQVEEHNWSDGGGSSKAAALAEFEKQKAPEAVHKGMPQSSRQYGYGDGLVVGATVRMLKQITFRSGRQIQPGDYGTISKIPGDAPGSPCQVRVADIIYSADPGDVEAAQLGPSAALPLPVSPAQYHIPMTNPSPPLGYIPVQTPYGVSPSMASMAPPPLSLDGFLPRQNPQQQQQQPYALRSGAGPPPPVMPVSPPRARESYYFHDTGLKAPPPNVPPPAFQRNPVPPPPPFQMRLTNERLNWQLLSGVDATRLMNDVDVDTLQGVMNNVAYAALTHEEAAQLAPRHTQHLFTLSQLLVQYLVYTQAYIVEEKEAMAQQAEDQYMEACALRELYNKQTHDFKEVLLKEKHMRKTLYAYELAMGKGSGFSPGTVPGFAGGVGADGQWLCSRCGRTFKKEAHLLSHTRKRHGGDVRKVAAGVLESDQMKEFQQHTSDQAKLLNTLVRDINEWKQEIGTSHGVWCLFPSSFFSKYTTNPTQIGNTPGMLSGGLGGVVGGVGPRSAKDYELQKREQVRKAEREDKKKMRTTMNHQSMFLPLFHTQDVILKEQQLQQRIHDERDRKVEQEREIMEKVKVCAPHHRRRHHPLPLPRPPNFSQRELAAENARLRKQLSQKPQMLSYDDSSDDEPTDVAVEVNTLTHTSSSSPLLTTPPPPSHPPTASTRRRHHHHAPRPPRQRICHRRRTRRGAAGARRQQHGRGAASGPAHLQRTAPLLQEDAQRLRRRRQGQVQQEHQAAQRPRHRGRLARRRPEGPRRPRRGLRGAR